MRIYQAQAVGEKGGVAVAPLVLLGRATSALLVRGSELAWTGPLAGASGAARYDPRPLFWISIGCGVLILLSAVKERGFIGWWLLIFMAGGGLLFFAGSARHLSPLAAPVAVLAVPAPSPPVAALGFGFQLGLSPRMAIL